MKTKEEIYRKVCEERVAVNTNGPGPYEHIVIEAMDLYAAEFSKALRKENEELRGAIITIAKMLEGKNTTIEELKIYLKEAYA